MIGNVEYSMPTAEFPARNSSIDKVAEKVRQKFLEETGWKPESGLDITESLKKFVEILGGKIENNSPYLEIPQSDGSLVIDDKGSFIIYLSPFTGPSRDIFTIAHELGHFFLHYLFHREVYLGKGIKFYRYGKGILETQANRFAGSFLMPENEFIDKAKSVSCDDKRLASYFQTSYSSVNIRLKQLEFQLS